mmetsp:Transcript_119269/g.331501  ORF Transcript_119269/g.331501 Transcript_119269/m.331501 type:complete len:136 (+) Transcript_119269:298-705(+)
MSPSPGEPVNGKNHNSGFQPKTEHKFLQGPKLNGEAFSKQENKSPPPFSDSFLGNFASQNSIVVNPININQMWNAPKTVSTNAMTDASVSVKNTRNTVRNGVPASSMHRFTDSAIVRMMKSVVASEYNSNKKKYL